MDYSIIEHGSIEQGSKTFFCLGDNLFCVSSASIDIYNNNVWWFTRLFVSQEMRSKGVGTALVKKVVEFCKTNNISLINSMNPYGDLDFKQLKEFYIKNGFVETPEEGTLMLVREGGNMKEDMIME